MAENTWNKLPKEIKQKFDNDVDKFIAKFGTVEWANALGILQKPVVDEKTMVDEMKGEKKE